MQAFWKRFDTWADSFDPDVRDAIGAPSGWLALTVLVSVVIGVAGYVPGTHEWFKLDPLTAAACYAPAAILGTTIGVLQSRRLLSSRAFAVLGLIDSGLGQFFCWSLVALSEWPGAGLMVAFPALLCCFHGYAFRSSPRHPYIAAVGLLAVVGAMLLNSEPSHTALYALGAALSVGGSLVLGLNADLSGRSARQRVAIVDAINAQVLNDRNEQVDAISAILLEVRGTTHDASSALSSLVTAIERLAVLSARRPLQPVGAEQINELAVDLSASLQRLRELLKRARSPGATERLEPVSVDRLVQKAVTETQRRYSGVTIEVSNAAAYVDICGGEASLERVLSNLLSNACEGDGRRAASRVSVEVRCLTEASSVVIDIRDDGPGLPPGFDDTAVTAFRTTKTDGTGLGLYTTRQLLRASGGALSVQPRTDGRGAHARVQLRTSINPDLSGAA